MSSLAPRQAASPRRWWFNYRCRSDRSSALTYWITYLLAEPRDAAYTVPGRLACRIFGKHNVTCRGRRDHQRPAGGRTQ